MSAIDATPYVLLTSVSIGAFLGLHSAHRAIKESEKILRNEAEKIPSNERLQFFKREIKEIRDTSYPFLGHVLRGIGKYSLMKVAEEYLERDEYVDFLKEIASTKF